jgi:hypothetical protein
MTLPAERLTEFQTLAKENKWPPPDIFEKAAKIGSKAAKTGETPAQSTSGGSPSAAPTARKRRSAKAGA